VWAVLVWLGDGGAGTLLQTRWARLVRAKESALSLRPPGCALSRRAGFTNVPAPPSPNQTNAMLGASLREQLAGFGMDLSLLSSRA